MVGLTILAVLLLIAAAAPRYGYDSRVGAHARQRRPIDDLRALRKCVDQGWGARHAVSGGADVAVIAITWDYRCPVVR